MNCGSERITLYTFCLGYGDGTAITGVTAAGRQGEELSLHHIQTRSGANGYPPIQWEPGLLTYDKARS
jgi:hypothetical protein